MADGKTKSAYTHLNTPSPGTSSRQLAAARWVTVEPIIVAVLLSVTSSGLIRPLYVRGRVSDWYNHTSPNHSECKTHSDNDTTDAEIQAVASEWLLYGGLLSGIPSIFGTFILSTMSDKLGRKMSMIIPIIGFLIQGIIQFSVVFWELPIAVLFVGDFALGVSGGFGLIFAACISYIADVTSEKQRMMRIIIAELFAPLVSGINSVGQGYLIKAAGYTPTICIVVGASVFALMYVTVPKILLESVDTRSVSGIKFKQIFDSMKTLLKFNENGRRWHMLVLDFFIFFTMTQITGTFSIFVLYVSGQPFCFDSALSGIALSFGFITLAVGSGVGAKVFSLCFGEYWLMHFSCLSLFAIFLVMGLANSTLLIFVAMTVGCFRAIGVPVARSIISRICHKDEIGAAFAIVGCLESISILAAGQISGGVYAATVSVMPGLTFFLYAGATVVPIATIVILMIAWPRRKEYQPFEVEDFADIDTE